MRKNHRIITLTILAALATLSLAGLASAAIYPTVTVTLVGDEYTFTVNSPANATYPFGYFQVDAQVAEAFPYIPWTQTGPWVSNVDQVWTAGRFPVGPFTSAFWRASRAQEILPGTAWVGQFKLTVPNSAPVTGFVLTMDGVAGQNTTQLEVPGPFIVPEPSVLAAAAFSLMGFVAIKRKR